MTAVRLFVVIIGFVVFIAVLSHGEKIKPILYVDPNSCKERKTAFFDSISFSCKRCANGSETSPSGLSCICKENYKHNGNDPNDIPVCKECINGTVTSSDSQRCVHCPVNKYDTVTHRCKPCEPYEILVEISKEVNGTTIYEFKCDSCNDISLPDTKNNKCEICPKSYLIAGNGSCSCPRDKYEEIGSQCMEKSTLIPDRPSVYSIMYEEEIISLFLKNNVRKVDYECRQKNNKQSCQILANICVLQMYQDDPKQERICNNVEKWKLNSLFPSIYYPREDANSLLSSKVIGTHYKFSSKNKESRLNLYLAEYSLNGTLVKFGEVYGGMLQLCNFNFAALDKAFHFGTQYNQNCAIQASELWNKYRTNFYELFIKFSDGDKTRLFPVPVLIDNLKAADRYNNQGDRSQWQLVKRFMMVDNIGAIKYSASPSSKPEFVRYLSSMSIKIQFQNSAEGKIYPPLITLHYDIANRDDHLDKNAQLKITFVVDYFRNKWRQEEDLKITNGVLGAFAGLIAVIKAVGWLRRAGKEAIDLVTLVQLPVFACGILANIFFIITFACAFFQFVLFKTQDEAYMILPSVNQESNFRIFLYFIFTMKFIQVITVIISQVKIDIFLLDWERPREVVANGKTKTSIKASDNKKLAPVSIWRTYFIANEWNELQYIRRVNVAFQLLTVVFFFKVVGFEELARIEPESNFSPQEWSKFVPFSQTSRYALLCCIYLISVSIQYGIKKLIIERYMEDPLQQFVDLCYLSNISVFILSNGRFGYYIHGRAGVGHADTDMREMFEQLKREEDDLCSHRGLLPNTDIQTFQILVPQEIRNQYNKLMISSSSRPLQASRMQQSGRGNNHISTDMDRVLSSYLSMNKFLAGFIDHAIRDIDYQIKDKLFLENLLDMEFYEIPNRGIFYNDESYSFSSTLLLGCEWSLLLFELLLFCVVDLISQDIVLGAVITYLSSQIIKQFRKSLGRRNVAQKTLIDQRFLI